MDDKFKIIFNQIEDNKVGDLSVNNSNQRNDNPKNTEMQWRLNVPVERDEKIVLDVSAFNKDMSADKDNLRVRKE